MSTGRNLQTNATTSLRSHDGSLSVTDKVLALFDKRQFRAYREFSANTVIRMVITKNFYLTYQRLWTGQGAARMVIRTGGTAGGTFTGMSTKFGLNTVGGEAPGFATFSTGGTITGGVEREVLRADSSTSGGGSGNADQVVNRRYLPAGTYYFEIVVTGTTTGMYSLEWEEEV